METLRKNNKVIGRIPEPAGSPGGRILADGESPTDRCRRPADGVHSTEAERPRKRQLGRGPIDGWLGHPGPSGRRSGRTVIMAVTVVNLGESPPVRLCPRTPPSLGHATRLETHLVALIPQLGGRDSGPSAVCDGAPRPERALLAAVCKAIPRA
jgi:hypothetical protein